MDNLLETYYSSLNLSPSKCLYSRYETTFRYDNPVSKVDESRKFLGQFVKTNLSKLGYQDFYNMLAP